MVTVTSFGYGHNPAPQADITLDLRHNLRNPHHDPALRYMTGLDTAVRQHVLDTPGARTIVDHTAALVSRLLATHQPVSVATGCVGGRHRSVAIAEEIADALREAGVSVHVDHRDLSKPVIQYDEPVTRTYTHPDVLTTGVRERWADPETDPTRIDWAPRQAAAAIPFEVVDGRPLNPHAPTGIRYGRNQLGHWGEQLCADAIVTAFAEEGRWLLMVERGDGYGWALPGGTADPGETPEVAALRELREETGLRLGGVLWHVLPARYVPDPRASDEAWMVTVPVRTHLGTMPRDYLPTVVGADDARRAEWVRADSFTVLVRHLAKTYQGQVFAAHEAILSELLGRQHG